MGGWVISSVEVIALIPNVLNFSSIDGIPYARKGENICIKHKLQLYLLTCSIQKASLSRDSVEKHHTWL